MSPAVSCRPVALLVLIFAAALAPRAASQSVQSLLLHVFEGKGQSSDFGGAVAIVGDLNQDGSADILIGAPKEDAQGSVGVVRAFSGRDGSALHIWTGTSVGGVFGFAVADASDLDQDGVTDVLVGATFQGVPGQSGVVHAFSGAGGQPLFSVSGPAEAAFGYSVDPAGDVNADGFVDILAGAPFTDGLGLSCHGSVFVLSGKDLSILNEVRGESDFFHLGMDVDPMGDIDQDGWDDFVTGAHGDNVFGANTGSVRVYTGLTGAIIRFAAGDGPGNWHGQSVAALGDVDGDGVTDFGAGAPYNSQNGFAAGMIRVYSGKSGGTIYTRFGPTLGDNLGWSIDGAGDVDGDGLDDVIAGAIFADNSGALSGSAVVYVGGSGGVPLIAFPGEQLGDQLGWSVAGGGDLNQDGRDDLVAGARGWNLTGRVVSFVAACGSASGFGAGCPGQLGVPSLAASGCIAGGTTATVTLTGGPSNSAAFFVLGQQPGQVPLGGGCSLLVGAGFLGPFGPFPLSPFGTLEIELAAPVPWTQPSIFMQAFVVDPSAPLHFSATHGLRLDPP